MCLLKPNYQSNEVINKLDAHWYKETSQKNSVKSKITSEEIKFYTQKSNVPCGIINRRKDKITVEQMLIGQMNHHQKSQTFNLNKSRENHVSLNTFLVTYVRTDRCLEFRVASLLNMEMASSYHIEISKPNFMAPFLLRLRIHK